jgi:hypothetical protein
VNQSLALRHLEPVIAKTTEMFHFEAHGFPFDDEMQELQLRRPMK